MKVHPTELFSDVCYQKVDFRVSCFELETPLNNKLGKLCSCFFQKKNLNKNT